MSGRHVALIALAGVLFMAACRPEAPLPAVAPSAILTMPAPASTSTAVPASTPTSLPTFTPTPGLGSTMVRPRDGMVMVYVPAGEFSMGSPNGSSDQRPVHVVSVSAFWIDRSEVTNAMYVLCVRAGACRAPDSPDSSQIEEAQYGNHPVLSILWEDADSYCEWAGARLPSEAEWEKAARGTDERMYSWGNEAPTCDLANFGNWDGDTSYGNESTPCRGGTVPVGSFPLGASPYGALDMAGNAWEWVSDWYGEDYYAYSPASDPAGPTSGFNHTLRGGSWDDSEYYMRTTTRLFYSPSDFVYTVGFRCALDATLQAP